MHALDLNGHTAIVTGGAKGIGYATAERLLRSGAAVSLWDFDAAATEAAASKLAAIGPVHSVVVDCADEAAVDAALADTLAWRSPVDILIANASVVGAMKPAWEHTIDDWNRLLRLDLMSAVVVIRALVPGMVANGWGRIVTVASAAALEPAGNNVAYAAAKAGVVSLTKTYGRELARTGVTVNCIAPSGIDTGLLRALDKDYLDAVIRAHALSRLAQPEEVAAMIAWMASAECSYTTGAVFDCSGGRLDY